MNVKAAPKMSWRRKLSWISAVLGALSVVLVAAVFIETFWLTSLNLLVLVPPATGLFPIIGLVLAVVIRLSGQHGSRLLLMAAGLNALAVLGEAVYLWHAIGAYRVPV